MAGTGAYVDGYTQNSGIIAWTPINSTIDVSNSEVEPTSITGWIDDNNTAYSVNPGNWYETSTYYDSSVCHVDNKTQYCSYITKATSIYEDYFTTDVSETNPHRHLGNYYNWSSAIASNNSSTITDDYTIADNSICPKGWRLPQTIGSAGDFDQLNSIYNSAYSSTNQKDYGIFNAPFYGVRAGNISNNYMYNAGYYGNYETGTAHNDGFEFTLYFRSDNLRPRGMFGRGLGWSVRCLAR